MNSLNKIKIRTKKKLKYLILKKMDSKSYPDFLKNEYKKRTGEELDLESPKKYTEKMQYAKLYNNCPLKTKLSDKYAVREWVTNRIGSKYLIPLLGVWDDYSQINFDTLPSKFVLKTNHSSGWNLVVEEKSEINHEEAEKKFNSWLNKNFAFAGDLQLHYKDIEPKIIAEEYIEDASGLLIDYRFMCFNGEVYFCWVDFYEGDKHYSNIYNLEWELQPWRLLPMENYPVELERPEKFNEMVDIAKELSKGFSHVRVDLYYVNNEIFFGEMTFTSTGGYRLIEPEKYNYKLGDLWDVKGK